MKKILIVANDAGGSNFIASYFYFKNFAFDAILTGPAKKTFSSYKLKFKNYPKSKLKNIIKNYDLIITGTSGKSNLERYAIKISKLNKIKVITIIDHWSNYRSRFILNKNKILPDQIWVNNKKLNIFCKMIFFFQKIKIKIITNTYKKYLKQKYNQIKFRKNKYNQILFLAEPLVKKKMDLI